MANQKKVDSDREFLLLLNSKLDASPDGVHRKRRSGNAGALVSVRIYVGLGQEGQFDQPAAGWRRLA